MSFRDDLVERLEQIAKMMDLLGEDSFKSSAHSRAARAIGDLPLDISTIASDKAKLLEIDGVGQKIADKIIEFHASGKIKEHEELLAQVPAGLLDLLNVPGLGPKTLRVLWQEGGVVDRPSLMKIIESGAILKLPRMGAKSVDKLKQSLAFAETGSQRMPIGLAMPVAEMFVERLRHSKGVKNIAFAGSLRRGKDTIGDIDILVACADGGPVSEAFRTMPEVSQVLVGGDTKSSVRVEMTKGHPVQVDLKIVPPASWGAAMMYFTGSKEHNVAVRQRALDRGLTLNEYGLYPDDKQDTPPQSRKVKPVASATEAEIYEALDLPYIPPEIRENRAELDLKATPKLLDLSDIKAELHAHTTASDGSLSIIELAEAAKARGFHTIAVTDHSRSSAIANGLDVKRLRAHIKAVRAAAEKVRGITILAGSEVDILADGTLDYDDEVLAELDIVVASPHVALSQDPKTSTARLLKAIRNPLVHILGHPTGRLIGKRPGMEPDMTELIGAAKEHDVALEINAHWMRLDLRDTHVLATVRAGGKIAIDCDVHAPEDFDNLRYGVLTARRGWAEPKHCVNTWTAQKLHAWLKSKR